MMPSSNKKLYRSLSLLTIMIIVAGTALYLLHAKASAITYQVGNYADEEVRNADLLRIARFARDNENLIKNIDEAFQPATDAVTIIEAIESLGARTGAKVMIERAEKESQDGNNVLSISAQAEGGWNSVYNFIKAVDTLPYKHTTQSVTLSQSEKAWTVRIEMRVTMQ